jgi:ubiquinone/menaquinone biosynthesis C-methylase UbiE
MKGDEAVTYTATPEDELRHEFNRWAAAGRGEGMIEGHIDVTEQIIDRMHIQASDRLLDLGCGIGWATRLLAERATEGGATGVDISNEMIDRARSHPHNPPNVSFVSSPASALPFKDNYFDKALSIESLYYYPDPLAALREVFRVLLGGGRAFFMVNLYLENEGSHHWVEKLAVPVHLLSEAQYKSIFTGVGFREVSTNRIHDRRPLEALLKPSSFDTIDQVEQGLVAGSLLITGQK